jgi:hypothetical protein
MRISKYMDTHVRIEVIDTTVKQRDRTSVGNTDGNIK